LTDYPHPTHNLERMTDHVANVEEIRPKREPVETQDEASLRLEEEHRDRMSTEIMDQLEIAYKTVSDLIESQTHPGAKKIQ
jgi:hypothetical protein